MTITSLSVFYVFLGLIKFDLFRATSPLTAPVCTDTVWIMGGLYILLIWILLRSILTTLWLWVSSCFGYVLSLSYLVSLRNQGT